MRLHGVEPAFQLLSGSQQNGSIAFTAELSVAVNCLSEACFLFYPRAQCNVLQESQYPPPTKGLGVRCATRAQKGRLPRLLPVDAPPPPRPLTPIPPPGLTAFRPTVALVSGGLCVP